MPNFVAKFSEDMRDALFAAAIDRAMGVRPALRAAKAGELPGLSREDQAVLAGMSEGYAYGMVTDEKRRRGMIANVKQRADQGASEIAARLLALADREVRQLEAKGPRTPVDTGRAIAASKLALQALAVTAAVNSATKRPATTEAPAAAAPTKPRGLAARIAAESVPEQDNATTEPSAEGGTRPAQNGSAFDLPAIEPPRAVCLRPASAPASAPAAGTG